MTTARRPARSTTTGVPSWLHRLVPVLVLVGLMWVSELLDLLTPLQLDAYGIRPREADGLVGIVLSPFLHLGLPHLVANTSGLLVLGGLVATTTRHLWVVTAGVVLLGGAAVWLLGAPRTVVIGASGVVYGYAAFLVVYGFVSRRVAPALVGVLVAVLYGGLLWGVLPLQPGISWQGHLFGGAAGVMMAVVLGRRDRRPASARR
ncbi:rhomboid family intramembrane serine protease [Ornithinimicrobium humiphilum]|uniref:Membrane associated rhomboid family serine protease n=1 Tax=Ornithinimicrobium humiphilum TaxID=125288 RepID=A0A543K6X2_9MICO|nr:rhomboid family intramembrane serine protease [Ornithinimicrobium humiphilum]TQM90821.1 membrane associated rhomboid family serine protease [Ornithinimicrobium humiphilum]